MKHEIQKNLVSAICLIAAFILWTVAIQIIDVQPAGPDESTIGFAAMNQFFHKLTGVHMYLYTITDWLSLIPVLSAAGFASVGLIQWIKRKHIYQVDTDILLLGGFYLLVMAAYLFFEVFVVNYRPVLLDGHLEASYPSSTTMLVICVMSTTITQLQIRIKNKRLKHWIIISIRAFTVFMVIARLLSGVHWLSDIIGGILLSTGLVLLYQSVIHQKNS